MLKKIKDNSKKLFIKRKHRNSFSIKRNNKNKKPRLSVFKSCKHIYAQIIDDEKSITLVSFSTNNKEALKELNKKSNNIKAAELVGASLAKRAIEKNITEVVFDRGGYIFHGKIKAIATAARENGLKF